MFVRRFLLVLSIVLCGSLALAAAVLASGGGFGPGKFTFSSTGANATIGSPKGSTSPFINIQVSHGYNSFKPMHPNGPRVVMYNTMVDYMELDPATGTGGFGCFIIPDADFSVSKELQSATLNTTLTALEACPGAGVPVLGDKNPTAFAGFGGGGGGLHLPIAIHLTWTGNGAVSITKDKSSFACPGYTEDSTSTFTDSLSAASGSVRRAPVSADSANISTTDGNFDITGSQQPSCFGY